MNAKTIRDALATHRLVVVLGEGTVSLAIDLRYAEQGRSQVLAWSTWPSSKRARERARDAVGFACGRMERVVVLAALSDAFLRELSVCAMLHNLPSLAAAHGYECTISRDDVAVFVVEGLHLVPVEGSRHGWRIESEDEEMAKLDALMQDCFAEP